MSEIDPATKEKWSAKIAGASLDDQVDALRQIANSDHVTGLTVEIVELSGNRDDEVRMWAAEALERAVQPESTEVLRLIQLLESSRDGEVCYWSATMLGRLGSDAAACVGALQTCLRESDYLAARERAVWALSQLGECASEAKAALQDAAENGPPRLQRLATEALERLESDGDADSTGLEEAAA